MIAGTLLGRVTLPEFRMERRKFIRLAGLSGAAGATGCLDGLGDGNETGDGDGPPPEHVEVTVAPQRALRFDPEEVEVAVGGTVEWYFEAEGHNVTSHPEASDKCENPEGAEPFKSYEGDNHSRPFPVDESFEHTFETAGEYTYVCEPHSAQMVGKVTVVEV